MKRCPKCRRRFADESLNFCLEDGSPLEAERDSEPTLVSPTVAAPPISPQVRTTSSPITATQPSHRWILLAFIILLAVMLGGAAVALLYRINNWDSPRDEKASKNYPATPTTNTSENASNRSSRPTPEPSPAKLPNLSGEWRIVNTIERTSFPAYTNLRLGYRLVFNQTGSEFTADGQKITENGREMADYERTPIHLNGSVARNYVSATFVEEGLRRKTTGRFEWTITADDNQLRGTFVSTAAKSSGSSVATRER